jgi:hypothetical protein
VSGTQQLVEKNQIVLAEYACYFLVMKKQIFALAICMLTLSAVAQPNRAANAGSELAGSWTLIAADKLLPDGKQVRDYGAEPRGFAVFTADGHYLLEIFRSDRIKFASGDRAKGTPEEYRDAVLSTSCHFGTYDLDASKGTINFQVDRASFPNWDGTTRSASFTLQGDVLTWRSPARPDGSIPISTFKRTGK